MTGHFLMLGVLASTVLLFVIVVWHWIDAYADFYSSRTREASVPVLRAARGVLRLAWVRLIDSVAWFSLGVLMFSIPPPEERLGWTIVIVFVLVWLEIAKIFTDRITRVEVAAALAVQVEAAQYDAKILTGQLEKKHGEVMETLHVVETKVDEAKDAIVKKVEGAEQAATKAYDVANHVNEKFMSLHKLIQTKEDK